MRVLWLVEASSEVIERQWPEIIWGPVGIMLAKLFNVPIEIVYS